MNNGRKASSSEERSRRPFIRKYFWKKSIIIDRNSAVIPNYKSTGVRVVTVQFYRFADDTYFGKFCGTTIDGNRYLLRSPDMPFGISMREEVWRAIIKAKQFVVADTGAIVDVRTGHKKFKCTKVTPAW